MKKSEKY